MPPYSSNVSKEQKTLSDIESLLTRQLVEVSTIAGSVSTMGTGSKIERIKVASDYTRTLAYYSTTEYATSIIHTGTTTEGAETVTETITYINAAGGDFRALTIIYS